tara:strand:+ start:2261 stop:3256 length:996 start_codon:yes stop_codon:yes gene_type:complete
MGFRGHVTSIAVLLVLSVALSGCISNADSDESSTLVEVPFMGTVDERECFDFDNKERCWLLHIPETATYEFCLSNSCPLLIDVHGRTSTAEHQNNLSDYPRITDEDNAILVHPEGIDNRFNIGWCCGDEDDVGFILELIDKIIHDRRADMSRVYVTGWSNGCYMSNELASVASHKIAAVACMAGYTDEPLPANYSAIPLMEIHGLEDQIVPYGSSFTTGVLLEETLEGDEGAIQNMYWWGGANECSGSTPDFETVEWDYSVKRFTNCTNGADVVLVTMNYAQHNPYLNDYDGSDSAFFQAILTGNPTGIDASQMAWDFLSQYSKSVELDEG